MKYTKLDTLRKEILTVLQELTYVDLRTSAKDKFLNIRKKSNATPFGTNYVGITANGLIHFNTISYTNKSVKYDQYVQLVDLKKYVKEFKGKLKPIEIVRKALAGDIKVHCTDPSWKYWGFQYKGTVDDYAIEPETRFPIIRNPHTSGAVCKHLDTVLWTLPFKATDITSDLIKLGIFK